MIPNSLISDILRLEVNEKIKFNMNFHCGEVWETLYSLFILFTRIDFAAELLRVFRRLSMKEQWTDISLQYLTLKVLCSALSENSRGQNHFKSIGGLEVLLDGLGVPPSKALTQKNSFFAIEKR